MNKLLRSTMTLFAAVAALAAPVASAGDAPFYVGAGVSPAGHANYFGPGFSFDNTNHVHPYNVFGGYDVNDRFAIEAGYSSFGNFRFSTGAKMDVDALHVAARGNIALGDAWSLFGKAGIARLSLDASGAPTESASKVRPMFSAGVEYKLTPALGVSLELADYGSLRQGSGKLKTSQFEAALRYHF